MTKLGTLAIVLSAVAALIAACGQPAPTEPSVTTIQRASPPIPVPAPADWVMSAPRDLSDLSIEDRGMELALLNGCAGCHTVDGEPGLGPTWQGIFGSREDLEDGSTVTVDAEYITESVRNPGLKIVRGFDAIMPTFDEETLPADDVAAIIAYIESVK